MGKVIIMGISRQIQRRITLACALVLVVLVAGVFVKQYHVAAQKASDKTPTTVGVTKQEPAVAQPAPLVIAPEPAVEVKPEAAPTPQIYSYTAQPGDSFTQFARDAVHQYVTARKLQIPDAQLSSAEITLTNAAGAPSLGVGQQIHIAKRDVAAALGIEDK